MDLRVLRGDKGNDLRVRKCRTFSGALCSENQDVPGSSSSFRSEPASESASALASSSFVSWVGISCEMCAKVRA